MKLTFLSHRLRVSGLMGEVCTSPGRLPLTLVCVWRKVYYLACHIIVRAGSISTAEGSAIVRTGETVAVCGVKAVKCLG